MLIAGTRKSELVNAPTESHPTAVTT